MSNPDDYNPDADTPIQREIKETTRLWLEESGFTAIDASKRLFRKSHAYMHAILKPNRVIRMKTFNTLAKRVPFRKGLAEELVEEERRKRVAKISRSKGWEQTVESFYQHKPVIHQPWGASA
jgi:hypothetical protein